jgi:transcriptional regulator with XRE-family HTH domain
MKTKMPKWSGDRLRLLRREASLSQRDIATEFEKRNGPKIWDTTVSAWESGREPPKFAHLVTLAHILEAEIEDLFDWGSLAR